MAQAATIEEEETGPPCRRDAMERAMRLMKPSVEGVSAVQQLLRVPATWATGYSEPQDTAIPVPRIRSPRRRGIAPRYPGRRFQGEVQEGRIVLYPGGFVLEPSDPRHPCLNVSGAAIREATFYRDAFEVVLTSSSRIAVRTTAIEHIDSIFQAYFWNSVP